jgi:hypothetical protein
MMARVIGSGRLLFDGFEIDGAMLIASDFSFMARFDFVVFLWRVVRLSIRHRRGPMSFFCLVFF